MSHFIRYNGSNFVLITLGDDGMEQWVDAGPTLEGVIKRVHDRSGIVVTIPCELKTPLTTKVPKP